MKIINKFISVVTLVIIGIHCQATEVNISPINSLLTLGGGLTYHNVNLLYDVKPNKFYIGPTIGFYNSNFGYHDGGTKKLYLGYRAEYKFLDYFYTANGWSFAIQNSGQYKESFDNFGYLMGGIKLNISKVVFKLGVGITSINLLDGEYVNDIYYNSNEIGPGLELKMGYTF